MTFSQDTGVYVMEGFPSHVDSMFIKEGSDAASLYLEHLGWSWSRHADKDAREDVIFMYLPGTRVAVPPQGLKAQHRRYGSVD